MSLRPLLFLDIDGVLNNQGSAMVLGSPSHVFDPVSVGLVDLLCEQTGARIVISSAWRIGIDLPTLRDDMSECGGGILAKRVIDVTPTRVSPMPAAVNASAEDLVPYRGAEIKAWVERNNCRRAPYVIVDDDSDMLPEQQPFFVQTRFEDGFRFQHYGKALQILSQAAADSA